MAKRIENLNIVGKKNLTDDLFILELSGNEEFPEIKPGQFVEVKIDGTNEIFLRRPFSIHDIDYERKILKLLIQVAGKGTAALSKLKVNDSLNLIYPLGNSFGLPGKNQKVLLAGGGCGVAPLLFLGKYLKLNGYSPDVLLGFRNSSRIIEYDEYKKIGKVFLTTEDGSYGEKGFLVNHSVLSEFKYDKIYCCGPDPMMRAVARYCSKKDIDCEVSLENLMACGIGACLCCIVNTTKGNLCTCIDGPVFNIKDLKW